MKELFLNRAKEYFKDQYDEFILKMNEPCTHGLFLNTLKDDKENILKQIDFNIEESNYSNNSYKHENESIGKSKAYELGLIYPQGIEAQIPASLPNIDDKKIVLDMCASPGGKTIDIANRLKNDSLIISNEYTQKRILALLSNIERLGLSNVIVSNTNSSILSKKLESSIDLVFIDAPCSGEGMIRKYPEILDEYNEKNIISLSKIQKELLEDGYKCLKSNGQLVYSTCTYSYEEDENQINEFLNNHSDMKLISMNKLSFLNNTEGQFYAYMVKDNNDIVNQLKKKKIVKNKIVETFIKDNLNIDNYYLYELNKKYYLSLNELPELDINVIRYGVLIGELNKDRFEPEHHLYRSNILRPYFKNIYELNENNYDTYISGNTIRDNISDGYYLVTYKGYSLGFVKASKGQLNNKYPKGLRRMI